MRVKEVHLSDVHQALQHPVRRARGGRTASKAMEGDEDAELLRDEEEGGERAGHRVMVQPSLITGGTLREYSFTQLHHARHMSSRIRLYALH